MKCAACLAFNAENDAVSVVNGTEYCAQHAVQALAMSTSNVRVRNGGPMAMGGGNFAPMSQFTPPSPPVAPSPE